MPKVLFVSGSVGLGHVLRDVRIARELMSMRGGIEMVWLAADPATLILEQEGMILLPECRDRDVGTSVIEEVAKGSNVNMTEILYRVRKEDRYAGAVRTFDAIVKRERPDLVVADEAYELEGAHSSGKGKDWPPFVFLWDFVKVYPGSWRWRDIRTARLVNKGWDRAFRKGPEKNWTDIFLGDLEDIPDERLGVGMVNAREGAARRYIFAGNPLPFDLAGLDDREKIRKRLGYGQEKLLVCSAGGTAVGIELLKRCVDAYPLIKQRVNDARMLIVKGPRMTGELGPVPEGITVRDYVPFLHEHFAVADMAIVQGGGGTTLELAALRVPFLYFPLEGHSEQQRNVSAKLDRYGSGVRCALSKVSPQGLADLVLENMGKRPVPTGMSFDGCHNAARTIAEGLGRRPSL